MCVNIKYDHAKRVKPVIQDSNLNSRSDCAAARLIDVALRNIYISGLNM